MGSRQNCQRARWFPYVRLYPGENGEVQFDYLFKLAPDDPHKAIFKGWTCQGQEIVVKFAERYNSAAHRLLANHGLVPRLFYSDAYNTDYGCDGIHPWQNSL